MTPVPYLLRHIGGRFASFLQKYSTCLRERTPINSADIEIFHTTNGWMPRPRLKSGKPSDPAPLVRQFKVFAVGGDILHCRPIDENGQVTGINWPLQIAKPYLLRRSPFLGKNINGYSYAAYAMQEYGGTEQARRIVKSRQPQLNLVADQVVVPRYSVFVFKETPPIEVASVMLVEAFDDKNPGLAPEQIAFSDIIYAVRCFPNGQPYNVVPDTARLLSSSAGEDGLEGDYAGVYWMDLNVDGRAWSQP